MGELGDGTHINWLHCHDISSVEIATFAAACFLGPFSNVFSANMSGGLVFICVWHVGCDMFLPKDAASLSHPALMSLMSVLWLLTNALIIVFEWRKINWHFCALACFPMILFAAVGIAVSEGLDPSDVRTCLGLLVLITSLSQILIDRRAEAITKFAIMIEGELMQGSSMSKAGPISATPALEGAHHVRGNRSCTQWSWEWSMIPLTGAVSGILGGVAGVPGIPWQIYWIKLQPFPIENARPNTALIFSSLWIVHILNGAVLQTAGKVPFCLCPILLVTGTLGLYCGYVLRSFMKHVPMKTIILHVLLCTGAWLVVCK